MEVDYILSSFRNLGTDILEREVSLFKTLTQRLQKVEQFLQIKFADFAEFQPTIVKVEQNEGDFDPNDDLSNQGHSRKGRRKRRKNGKRKRSSSQGSLAFEIIDPLTQNEILIQPDTFVSSSSDSDDSSDPDFTTSLATQRRPSGGSRQGINFDPSILEVSISREHSAYKDGFKRKRTGVWNYFDTEIDQASGQVTINNCLKCGRNVSARADRMRVHVEKCTGLNLDADDAESANTMLEKEKLLDRGQGTFPQGDGEDGDESFFDKSSGAGRRRKSVWKFFKTSFDPEKGKIVQNKCRLCGEHVSPKAKRMQGHIDKCDGKGQTSISNRISPVTKGEREHQIGRSDANVSVSQASIIVKTDCNVNVNPLNDDHINLGVISISEPQPQTQPHHNNDLY